MKNARSGVNSGEIGDASIQPGSRNRKSTSESGLDGLKCAPVMRDHQTSFENSKQNSKIVA